MHDARTLPDRRQAERPGVGDWFDAADPPHEALRNERPTQLDSQHEETQEDGAVRIDPDQAEHGEEQQPPWVGPGLGQEQQLEREPDQGEVEPPVARRDAGDADGEQKHDDDDPAAGRPGPGVGGGRDETEAPEDDGVRL